MLAANSLIRLGAGPWHGHTKGLCSRCSAVFRQILKAILQSHCWDMPLGNDRTCLWRPCRCCRSRKLKRARDRSPPAATPAARHSHADVVKWKDVWNIRKWRTSTWISPGVSGILGWLACRKTPTHSLSKVFACRLFRHEGQLPCCVQVATRTARLAVVRARSHVG